MTTVIILDDGLKSYAFMGTSQEIEKLMQETYSTDPTYRRIVNSLARYSTIRDGLQNLRRLVKRSFGLEDKL